MVFHHVIIHHQQHEKEGGRDRVLKNSHRPIEQFFRFDDTTVLAFLTREYSRNICLPFFLFYFNAQNDCIRVSFARSLFQGVRSTAS